MGYVDMSMTQNTSQLWGIIPSYLSIQNVRGFKEMTPIDAKSFLTNADKQLVASTDDITEIWCNSLVNKSYMLIWYSLRWLFDLTLYHRVRNRLFIFSACKSVMITMIPFHNDSSDELCWYEYDTKYISIVRDYSIISFNSKRWRV